jgi:FKBP-type peptidyl-prolyl cis-trans isomerase
MKSRLFIIFFAILSAWITTSCKRENADEVFVNEQIKRNEREIQEYIASKGLQMQKDGNGIYYQVSGTPTGESPDTTYRYVEIKYEVRLIPSETPVDTNYSLKGTKTLIAPVINPASGGSSVIIPRGIDLFMQLGKQVIFKGQKAILLMDHRLGYNTASTPFLPPYAAIRVDLEVVEVKSEEQYISERLQSMGLVATSNREGVVYARTDLGSTQEFVRDSSNVTIKYVGRNVIENNIFDSNQSFTFRPYGGVISGFRLGIPLMKLGEKGYLFIPSRFAYGSRGSGGSIRPFAPIYFEIEVLDVRND